MAHQFACSCGRQYAVAATAAGSTHECLCGQQLLIPRWGLLREGFVVPEPSNKVIELIDPRSLSHDNEAFVLVRYASEYELFAQTRSRGKILEDLSPHGLASFDQDQIVEIMEREYRRAKRREGMRCLTIGLITMPFTAIALALS